MKETDERTTAWHWHSHSVFCIHWFAHRGPAEAWTITSSHHLWRELCWRRAASCASLICCLKMPLIGLCCRMNKLYSWCFLDENPLCGWSAAVHLGTEEWGASAVVPAWCTRLLPAQIHNGVVKITSYCQPQLPIFNRPIRQHCTLHSFVSMLGQKLVKYFSQDIRCTHTDNTDAILGYKGPPDLFRKLLELMK